MPAINTSTSKMDNNFFITIIFLHNFATPL